MVSVLHDQKEIDMSLMTRRAVLSAAAMIPTTMVPVALAQTEAPSDALLYIIWPNDGQKIKGAFWCRFGLRNMGIARAGDRTPNAGHHHLFVDVDEEIQPGAVIPSDKNHIHFGAGQSEARIELPPGRHTLQLVLGDAAHKVFSPAVVSQKITVTVY
jgi:hypothetical protein